MDEIKWIVSHMYAKRRIMDVMSIQLARRIAQRLRRGCPLTCVSPDDMPSKRGGLMGRQTRWQASPASRRNEMRSSGDGAAHKPVLVKLKPAPSKPRTPASDTQRNSLRRQVKAALCRSETGLSSSGRREFTVSPSRFE